MSQEASTKLIIPEVSEELIASEPWSIETYADGFMDDLFADIDDILDGRSALPPVHPVQPYSSYMQTSQSIVLPERFVTSVQLPTQVRENQLSTVVVNTPVPSQRVRKIRRKSGHWFGKLFTFGAGLGLAIASVVWAVNSGLISRLSSPSFQQALQTPKPQLPSRAEIQTEFVNYMLGALSTIDRQGVNNNQSSKPVLTAQANNNQNALAYINPQTTTTPSNLPPLPAANNTPINTPTNRPNNVVERVYIPVYQAPLPMRYVPPTLTTGVNQALPPLPNTIKAPNKAATVKPAAQNIKPVALNPAPLRIRPEPKPAIPPAPLRVARVPQAPPPAPKTPEVTTVATTNQAINTLEGLLELGGKSAALFKINGVTRRIDIGETIGSSGWTLVDVANGEAIIRRNGEVRSIFTGQKF
ncbi:hypothetical protein [Calothrix sp. 336/3]|uniref:hypothetical protein n=1 Tax=Calothrix sp. 336/3 TaxID=1337936 RepID=UPI0004E39FFA|nr:hypothetical protein [Calothrix sp. 336/3]AKG21632.1 hypothetical protein IJ00_10470 [Calothrix sp. 336/3]